MFLEEIEKELSGLKDILKAGIDDQNKINDEIKSITESLQQAKKNRDNANDSGDTIAWKAAMGAIAAANKQLEELKNKRHNLKSELEKLSYAWPTINKATGPLLEEKDKEMEVLKKEKQKIAGIKSQILAFAFQLSEILKNFN